MFGFFGQPRCDLCGNILRRAVYTWTIDGRDRRLCPTCSTRYERKVSKLAFERGAFHADKPATPNRGVALLVIIGIVALYGISLMSKTESNQESISNARAKVVASPDNKARDEKRAEWVRHGIPEPFAASAARALAKYPALGVAGSKLNNKFVEMYRDFWQRKDGLLNSPNWPELLADECAARL